MTRQPPEQMTNLVAAERNRQNKGTFEASLVNVLNLSSAVSSGGRRNIPPVICHLSSGLPAALLICSHLICQTV